jgi:fucose 4-O-acetylase-like acetyltransferase
MDVLKGIILTVIVFGHMLVNERTTNVAGLAAEQSSGGMPIIVQALYLGLMAFFILSGYFYRPKRTFKENMIKRLKQIGIPFVLAGVLLPLITYLYLLACGYNLPIDDYFTAAQHGLGIYNAFAPNGTPYVAAYSTVTYGAYFLAAMLWGFLFFYALAPRVLDDYKKVLVTIIVFLAIEFILVQYCPIKLPLYFKMGPIAAAFMMVGACLAKVGFLENVEYGNKRELKYWLIPIVFFAAGFTMCYFLPPNIMFDQYYYGSYGTWSLFPYFIESVLMFIPIAYIGFIFSKIPLISKVFDLFGKHTMGTILIHPVIAKMLVAPFYMVSAYVLVPNEVPMEYRLFIAVMSLVIPVLICHFGPKIIEKIKGARGSPQES